MMGEDASPGVPVVRTWRPSGPARSATLGSGLPRVPYCSSSVFRLWSLRQSRAVGIGHAPASAASSRPCVLPWLGLGASVRFSLSLLLGVGQSVIASIGVFPAWMPVGGIVLRFAVLFRVFLALAASGVGHIFAKAARAGRIAAFGLSL